MIAKRLWLIPVWFVAQFLYEIPGAWSEDHASFANVLIRAFEAQTSLNALWVSFVVVVAVALYAMNKPKQESQKG